MKAAAESFLRCTNAFDVEGALRLFTPDAIIDDVSVGEAFVGAKGIRRYLEQFFVGYKTASTVLSTQQLDARKTVARVDFTGDFGHEIGILKFAVNADGFIERIDADLE
ncbi:MAG: nuclear transport factor 2 family protein [Achromobacter sp.]|uniref:nuclear transport factor 2 family protein n=1 Tax=Achromobacter sp. TaxID=134375 RepID=UPI003D0889FF